VGGRARAVNGTSLNLVQIVPESLRSSVDRNLLYLLVFAVLANPS
jgi:hypothetical protein